MYVTLSVHCLLNKDFLRKKQVKSAMQQFFIHFDTFRIRILSIFPLNQFITNVQ